MAPRHIVAIGGSDAGMSAALRARELDPTSEVTVVVADAYTELLHLRHPLLRLLGSHALEQSTATRINVDEHTLDLLKPTAPPSSCPCQSSRLEKLRRGSVPAGSNHTSIPPPAAAPLSA